jgi:hypothetical protein
MLNIDLILEGQSKWIYISLILHVLLFLLMFTIIYIISLIIYHPIIKWRKYVVNCLVPTLILGFFSFLTIPAQLNARRCHLEYACKTVLNQIRDAEYEYAAKNNDNYSTYNDLVESGLLRGIENYPQINDNYIIKTFNTNNGISKVNLHDSSFTIIAIPNPGNPKRLKTFAINQNHVFRWIGPENVFTDYELSLNVKKYWCILGSEEDHNIR